MNRRDCLCLTTSGEEILGRLKKMEKEEACYKHRKYYGTSGNIEISPAPILSFVAACYTWGSDITRE